jgi:hypothetical protein
MAANSLAFFDCDLLAPSILKTPAGDVYLPPNQIERLSKWYLYSHSRLDELSIFFKLPLAGVDRENGSTPSAVVTCFGYSRLGRSTAFWPKKGGVAGLCGIKSSAKQMC